MQTWVVSRYSSSQRSDDCFAIYALSDGRLDVHARVFKRHALWLEDRIRHGKLVRRPRWRIDLGEVVDVVYDDNSKNLVFRSGSRVVKRLVPTTDDEVAVLHDIFCSFTSEHGPARLVRPSSRQRLVRSIPGSDPISAVLAASGFPLIYFFGMHGFAVYCAWLVAHTARTYRSEGSGSLVQSVQLVDELNDLVDA